MKKITLALVSVASLIFVVGSVGAFEYNNITMLQCLAQCAIGAGVEWFTLSKIETIMEE